MNRIQSKEGEAAKTGSLARMHGTWRGACQPGVTVQTRMPADSQLTQQSRQNSVGVNYVQVLQLIMLQPK